jgi:hypothetical protein
MMRTAEIARSFAEYKSFKKYKNMHISIKTKSDENILQLYRTRLKYM